jgi:uncharacterized protein (TIGR02246 family)
MRGLAAIAAGLMALGMTTVGTAPASAAEPAPSLEQRVQRIEDEAAIRVLLQTYANRLVARDFDGYVQLFAPDGVWNNGPIVHKGRADIKAMLVAMFPATPADYVNTDSYMLVSNIVIDLAPDGTHAHAQSRQLSIMRGEGGTPTPLLSGMYEDELVKLDGQWKFQHRNDITLMPSMDEWQKRMREGVLMPEKK